MERGDGRQWKKWGILAGKIALLGGMVGYLLYSVQAEDSFDRLMESFRHPETIRWPLLLGGWLAFFVGICINIFRWQLLTRTLGLRLDTRDAFRIGLISHFVSQLGFGLGLVGGDTVRAVFLTRTNPNQGAEATTAVVMDRVVGLMALLILGGIGSLFLDTTELEAAPVSATVAETDAAVAGSASAARAPEREANFLVDIVWVVRGLAIGTVLFTVIALLPGLKHSKLWGVVTHVPLVGKILQRLVNSVRIYHARIDRLLIGIAISLFVQSLFVLSLHGVTEGLNIPHPDLKTHFSIAPISFVAGALPIGAWEIVLEGMYLACGMRSGDGLIAALAYRLGTIVTALVGLVVYLTTRAESGAVLQAAEEKAENAQMREPT